jgi:acyl carrier protein
MDMLAKQQLRAHIADALASQDGCQRFEDDESLFLSGRLDFLAMMNLIVHLEQAFKIDFRDTQFDTALVDSVREIELLIDWEVNKQAKLVHYP